MHTIVRSVSRRARPPIAASLVVAILALAGLASPIAAADPSTAPAAPGSPVASDAPPTMCESFADLQLYVGFLRQQSVGEDGLLPILVGSVASLSEAQTLAGLVGEAYRPLVEDLATALADLRTSVRGLREADTVGSGLVGIGEAIVGVGARMDALGAALREPCPEASPDPSGSPAA
jgi:hypothetical protein